MEKRERESDEAREWWHCPLLLSWPHSGPGSRLYISTGGTLASLHTRMTRIPLRNQILVSGLVRQSMGRRRV